MEGQTSGSIYPYTMNGNTPSIMTYTKQEGTYQNNFGTYRITINKTIKSAINDNTIIMPTAERTLEDIEITRPMPFTSNAPTTRTTTKAVKYHINETYMTNTQSYRTAIVLPLNTGQYGNGTSTINGWGIRNKTFDVYFEIWGDDVYQDPTTINSNNGLHAVLLFSTTQLLTLTSDAQMTLSNTNCIELETKMIANDKASISGIIKEDALIFQNSAWTSSTGKMYLVIWSDSRTNFGAYGMGSIDIICPDRNADTFDIIYTNEQIFINDNLGTYISSGTGFYSAFQSGKNFVENNINGLQFFALPMGYIVSYAPLISMIMVAIALALLNKAAN